MTAARPCAPAARERALAFLARVEPAPAVPAARGTWASQESPGETGLVAGLHVVGSAVLEDYRDGSDLDLVVELVREPAAADLEMLAAAHRADPGIEATYVPAGALALPVDDVPDGPWAADGELHTDSRCFQLNPVTWHQLARHAVSVRGALPVPGPPVEYGRLAAFCAGNLREYWAPLLDVVRRMIADRAPDEPADATAVQWMALGPARLWHTIRTGEVVSKTRAGELAAAHWPDLAPPLLEVVASRRGDPVALTTRHAAAAVTVGARILT